MILPTLSTCDWCDRHRDAVDDALRVLPPTFRHFGATAAFAGPVVTVRCFEDNSFVKAAVEQSGLIDTPQGPLAQVLVVAGGGSVARALVGGNLAASAARNGWAGIVVDGAVRDVAELAAEPIGICALATNPLPTAKRDLGERGVAVTIQGRWVRPGDWIVADADGIIVLAPHLIQA